MDKKLWKKLQMGLISLSAVGLLAACGMDDVDDTPDDDPAIEEPVDGEEEIEDVEVDESDVDETEEDDAS